MDNSDIAEVFVGEMRTLSIAVRNHLRALWRPDAPASAAEGAALFHNATEMFDLSATFGAEDCALVCRALAGAYQDALGDQSQRAPFATIDAALTYVEGRLDLIASARWMEPPRESDMNEARRLARTLQPDAAFDAVWDGAEPPAKGTPTWSGSAFTINGGASAHDEMEEPLTEAELAILAEFRVSTLRTGADTPIPTGDPPGGDEDLPITLVAPAVRARAESPHEAVVASSAEASRAAPTDTQAVAGPRRAPTAEELDVIPPEMRHLFLVETAEDVQDLRVALLKLGQRPDDHFALPAMSRIAHKIRGAAGTLQFPTYAEIAMVFEELLKTVQQSGAQSTPTAQSVLLRGLVILQSALASAESKGDADQGLLGQARALYDELRATGVESQALSPRAEPSAAPTTLGTAADSTSKLPRGAEGESLLRVDVRRLDTLISHAAELTMNRAGMSHHIEDVGRLQAEMELSLARLRQLSAQLNESRPADSPPQTPTIGAISPHAVGSSSDARLRAGGLSRSGGAPGHGLDWDELELDRFTETDDALRSMAEAIADLNTNARALKLAMGQLSGLSVAQAELATEIQRDVMHVRLVPLSDLVPRLHVEVKGISAVVRKEVLLTVRGEMTQIDRNISEALSGPLIELMRNAVAHGIEPADERVERGKSPVGSVWMHAYYVGSEVVIEVGDDGKGLNPHYLAHRAVARNFISEETARSMTPQDALDLMFLPGFTTVDRAQSVAGRGIGLDDVRTKIQGLKGSIQVRGEPGQGAVFRVRVPISLSVVRALRVRAGDEVFAAPVSSVQHTASVSALDILTSTDAVGGGAPAGGLRSGRRLRVEVAEESLTGEQQYEEIPVFVLAELLDLAAEPRREPAQALIIEAGRRRVALLVDDVADASEVVVQALPEHLRRHAVRGATVTPDGQVRLVLDLPELVAALREDAQVSGAPRLRPVPRLTRALAPRVLVVDDSVSIRRTVELTLSRAHFDVQVARDGVEALEMMLVSPPRVLMLDIEMPRLDGFELLSIMRESPQFAEVRVVMLTARASEKHRRHAHALGASAYLLKPCPQEVLVDTVRGLLEETSAP
ncbi:MAG TPA: response regulator [Ktedonobacterales bacterium]|nr:response regulator [Ktedonobacterales bacterium]